MVTKRSIWKIPFVHSSFFKRRTLFKNSIKLYIRNSLIPNTFLHKRIRVHNGIWYLSSDITSSLTGFKTGEFSYTRRCDPLIHGKHKQKRKKKGGGANKSKI